MTSPRDRRILLPCLLGFFCALAARAMAEPAAELRTIWQIGESDNRADEFALAPKGYLDFLQHDFGWQDRFYLIGHSRPQKDWPYVLPGPADAWAGSGGLAGIRTQVLNILFDLERCPEEADWKLVVDLVDTQPSTPPLFKVKINGRPWTFPLAKGTAEILLETHRLPNAPMVVKAPPATALALQLIGHSLKRTCG
jgi:hypothetical protein